MSTIDSTKSVRASAGFRPRLNEQCTVSRKKACALTIAEFELEPKLSGTIFSSGLWEDGDAIDMQFECGEKRIGSFKMRSRRLGIFCTQHPASSLIRHNHHRPLHQLVHNLIFDPSVKSANPFVQEGSKYYSFGLCVDLWNESIDNVLISWEKCSTVTQNKAISVSGLSILFLSPLLP